jgi:hypothetical protein
MKRKGESMKLHDELAELLDDLIDQKMWDRTDNLIARTYEMRTDPDCSESIAIQLKFISEQLAKIEKAEGVIEQIVLDIAGG